MIERGSDENSFKCILCDSLMGSSGDITCECKECGELYDPLYGFTSSHALHALFISMPWLNSSMEYDYEDELEKLKARMMEINKGRRDKRIAGGRHSSPSAATIEVKPARLSTGKPMIELLRGRKNERK